MENGDRLERRWTAYPAKEIDEFEAHRRAVTHVINHAEALMAKYPDQWIGAWIDEGSDPILVFGDSMDAVIQKAHDRKLSLRRSYIRHLSTHPNSQNFT